MLQSFFTFSHMLDVLYIYYELCVNIGVGNKIDVNELYDIASKPDYVFKVNAYGALKEFKKIVAMQTCKGLCQYLVLQKHNLFVHLFVLKYLKFIILFKLIFYSLCNVHLIYKLIVIHRQHVIDFHREHIIDLCKLR